MTDIDRLPPNDRGAEEAVLGGVMVDPQAIHEVSWLSGHHFYASANGIIFDTMRSMILDGIAPDVVTLDGRLKAAGLEFELADLVGLMTVVPTSTGVANYARIVVETHSRRQMIMTAGTLANVAYDESKSMPEVLKTASAALLDVSMNETSQKDKSIKTVASEAFDEVVRLKALGGVMQGISSGHKAVDDIIRGFQGARLYLGGARPGVGKTAWATNFAVSAARSGKRVMFFTLEMSIEQLTLRMATHMAEVSYENLSEGRLNDDEMERVGMALGELAELPIVMVSDVRTPGAVYSSVVREQAIAGCDLIIIDYLQLMRPDKAYGTRVLEVGALSRALAIMAINIDLPIVALVQLSRALELRKNKRPILTDLRDSGELEQDAGIVFFLYRGEYYYREEDNEDDDELDYIPGDCEFIVAKNRFGRTGTCHLHFEGFSGKFSEHRLVTTALPGPVND